MDSNTPQPKRRFTLPSPNSQTGFALIILIPLALILVGLAIYASNQETTDYNYEPKTQELNVSDWADFKPGTCLFNTRAPGGSDIDTPIADDNPYQIVDCTSPHTDTVLYNKKLDPETFDYDKLLKQTSDICGTLFRQYRDKDTSGEVYGYRAYVPPTPEQAKKRPYITCLIIPLNEKQLRDLEQ